LVIAGIALWAGCQGPPPAAPVAIEKTATDGDVELTLRVDRDRISVADNLHVRVEAAFPESKQVDFPDALGDEAEFRSASTDATSPRLGEDGKVRVEQSYVVEPYVAGKLTIPAIKVHYRDKGALEDEKTVATEPFEVEVEPVPSAEEETAELRDIHDPLAVPFPTAWLVGGALAALVAAAAAWYWWKSRQVPAPVVEMPPDPADVIALRELDNLIARGLALEGRIKELYAGVSDILRRYIEARFGLHAPEQTTEEFLLELRRTLGFDAVHRALLRNFLEHTDLVKFAEARPTSQQVDETIAACRRFIVETKPKPAPEAVEGPVVPRA
jgi:hypothetical protein